MLQLFYFIFMVSSQSDNDDKYKYKNFVGNACDDDTSYFCILLITDDDEKYRFNSKYAKFPFLDRQS